MKKLSSSFLIISILLAGIFISCKKESSFNRNTPPDEVAVARSPGRGKNPRPPVANAGPDQKSILPLNTVALDGSASTDPNNNISGYLWTKVSGPSTFAISNANAVQTQVTNLIEGVYKFELKVTDAGGLFDKDTVQVTVNSEGSPPPPCTTNCGKIVFVSDRDGNNEIYSCNADGSNITRLTNDPAWDAWPAWSPEGARIAFTRDGYLFIMNADGSNVVQKTFANDVAEYPAWSPDGTRIAFSDGAVIMMIDLTNDAISYVPNTVSTGIYVTPTPAWSPDGTKIAFDSDMLYPNWGLVDIFTISPQGSGLTNLTPNISGDYDYLRPSWSPGGTKLSVGILQYPDNYSIAVMNADGTGLAIIRTIKNDAYSQRTSWSPDGTRIAYTESNTIKWVAANGSAGGTIVANGWDADWKH